MNTPTEHEYNSWHEFYGKTKNKPEENGKKNKWKIKDFFFCIVTNMEKYICNAWDIAIVQCKRTLCILYV